jgi:hypothetical protein
MAVKHDLCTKRGMTRDFDGEVSPVGILDVERVVIDIAELGLQVLNETAVGSLNHPYSGYGSRHQNQEDPADSRIVLEMLRSNFMLVFFTAAIDDGNVVGFSPTSHPTTEVPRHPHQMSIV